MRGGVGWKSALVLEPRRRFPSSTRHPSGWCGRWSSPCRRPRSWWAGWLAWGGALHWQDLLVLAITYTLTGLGITVGYHRLFTHRSFKTTRTLRALFAVLGSMAVEGPVIEWVATHRKHHRFSDHPGDPHSPHLDRAPGWRGALRGLGHAHLGWMFRGKDMANPARYAKDLLADRDLRFISRTFPLWVAVGLAVPFGSAWRSPARS